MSTATSEQFVLTINLGNDAMQTAEDIADALIKAARRIADSGDSIGVVLDANGNKVGSYQA